MCGTTSLLSLTYHQASSSLEGRGFGIVPGLERIGALMDLLSQPQLSFQSIHLAGTNGKTSTARMIAAILGAHGLNTGLYTSPHLHTVRERFVLAGWHERLLWDQMSEAEFASTLSYLLPFVELVESRRGEPVTYFELATAMAFEWMSQRSVAAGVIEAGMGGRWDATNLVDGMVAVLTPIDVDHSSFLGTTPLSNAEEKVEIIKPGATVVAAAQRPEVARLIEQRATAAGAFLVSLGREIFVEGSEGAAGGRVVTVRTQRTVYEELYLPLFGMHQGTNLALAAAAAESFLDRRLDDAQLRAGLASVRSPGRMEVVGRAPLVVLDGAHNPLAARALAATVSGDFLYRSMTLVVSIFEDKDIAGMLGHLMPLADRVVLTRMEHPRGAAPLEMLKAMPQMPVPIPQEIIEPLEEAVDVAIASAGPQDLVLITGSLQAVGQARRHLLGL